MASLERVNASSSRNANGSHRLTGIASLSAMLFIHMTGNLHRRFIWRLLQ